MKKLEKKVDELMESLKKDQGAFTMCCNEEGNFFYSYSMRMEEIGAGIASILSDWFEDDNAQAKKAAIGIIAGLHSVIAKGDKASDAVMGILAKVAAERTMKKIERLKASLEGVDFDDSEDEDCENCEHNRDCNHPSAIAYRKANGIPAPKKVRKSIMKRKKRVVNHNYPLFDYGKCDNPK